MNDQYLKNYNGTSIQGATITTIDTTTGDLWSQLNTDITNPWRDVTTDRLNDLEKQIELVKLDNKLLRLKMLSMEGKFTAEEVTNIRKMLMSNDEASKTLADSIIENA
jgi:cell shape-determining protein MreC